MERSESINELATALSKAQGEMHASGKTGTNPFFKHAYATFDDVLAAVKKPLANNGLSFVQLIDQQDGTSVLTTILIHSSGQYMSSSTPLNAIASKGTNALQDFGKAITYMKRYALAAMLGVAGDEDDDGNSAGKPVEQPAPAPTQAEPIVDFDATEPIAADEQFIVSVKVGCWETKAGKKYIGFWEDGQQYPSIPWWDGREAFLDKFTDDVMTKDGLGAKGTTYPFSAKVFYTLNDKGYKDLVRVERI